MSSLRTTLALGAMSIAILGCSSVSLDPAAPSAGRSTSGQEVRTVKSPDGKFEGEVSGAPAPDSRFAKLRIGMELQQVLKLIGNYDELFNHETGKRWIPFYLGSDARRVVTHYKGEGCLSFTGGNVWGGGSNQLIRMDVDPAGKCYQP